MNDRFNPHQYWEARHETTTGLDGVGYLGLSGYNEWMYRLRRRVFRRMLRPYRSRIPSARVLDVGSGTGFYLKLWSDLGPKTLIGSDFSQVACDRMQVEFPKVEVRQLDITSTDPEVFESLGQFDFISVMDVLYHLVSDEKYAQAFQNLSRRLRPGGALIFTENFLQHRPRFGNEWHISRERVEIEGHLAAAGLRMDVRRPWFVIMNGPVDSDRKSLQWHWWLIRRISARSRMLGTLMGAAEYPAEVLLTKWLHESPTSEIAIAIKT